MTEKWPEQRIDAWHRYIAEEELYIKKRKSDLSHYQSLIQSAEWGIDKSERNIAQYKADLKEQEALK